MLTAHKIKILQSLDQKKYRQKYNLFLVEGNKTISEIPASGFIVQEVFSVEPAALNIKNIPVHQISTRELKKISFLQHPKDSVAICSIPPQAELKNIPVQLVLDGIQDPGNLGTIIRLADWFGLEEIICSPDTVDVYNPKVIQASMGSFLRVNVAYLDLPAFLENTERPVFGADMEGENLFSMKLPEDFCLVMGNEGNGIRPATAEKITRRLTIPRFGRSQATESLNVASATGIILGRIFGQK